MPTSASHRLTFGSEKKKSGGSEFDSNVCVSRKTHSDSGEQDYIGDVNSLFHSLLHDGIVFPSCQGEVRAVRPRFCTSPTEQELVGRNRN
jgi:hypothetical protein